MTHTQAAHMFAAALHAHPAGDTRALHERLRGKLNAFPVPARREALEVARPLFRLSEYYEARNSELRLIADVIDRGSRGLSVEQPLARLETYWQRVCAYLRALGPHPGPLATHGPHPDPMQFPSPMEAQ